MTAEESYRARLRGRVFLWGDRFTDRACDLPDTRWRWVNDLPFVLERTAQRVSCAVLGHHAIPDQCGIPAHDFCVWCRTSMPDARNRSVQS